MRYSCRPRDGAKCLTEQHKLRKGIHTLFDRGYITVSEDLEIQVSKRINKDYVNSIQFIQWV